MILWPIVLFHIMFNTLIIIICAPSGVSSLRVVAMPYHIAPSILVQCPPCNWCSVNIVRINILALITNY